MNQAASGHELNQKAGRGRLVTVALAVSLALTAFVVEWMLAGKLEATGAFKGVSRLFGADPRLLLRIMLGTAPAFRLAHPAFYAALGLPLAGLSKLLSIARGGGTDTAKGALQVAQLVVSPASAAMLCVALLFALRAAGLSLLESLVATVFGAASFSFVLFGSIPESYMPSALLQALGVLLALRTREVRGPGVEWIWFSLALLASSIVITNVIPIALLYLSRAYRIVPRPTRTLLRTLVLLIVAPSIALLIGFTTSKMAGLPEGSAGAGMAKIRQFVDPSPMATLLTFPTAVANGVAPPMPRMVSRDGIPIRDQVKGHPRTFLGETDRQVAPQPGGGSGTAPVGKLHVESLRVTLHTPPSPLSVRNLVALSLIILAGCLARKSLGRQERIRAVYASCLGILLYNWVFHGMWGDELFLYSMHWHVPVIFMAAAPLVLLPGKWRVRYRWILGLGAVGVAVNSARVTAAVLSYFSMR